MTNTDTKKVEEAKEAPVEAPKKKAESFSIVAKFKSRDEDGNTIVNSFESKGATVKELLAELDFPKGVNCLVQVSVQRNDHKLEKSLAPHKARKVLEFKDVTEFENVFRGL